MVSALVSGLSGPASSPDRGYGVVFSGEDSVFSQCFSPSRCIYNWVLANFMLRCNPAKD